MITCHLTTPRAQQWLSASREVRILHLFDDVCNLVNGQGDVVSLVNRRIGPGPFALVLGKETAWPRHRHSPVRVDPCAQRLYAGSLAIAYGSASCWQPRPAWGRLRECFPRSAGPLLDLSAATSRLLEQLLDGIFQGDATQVENATVALAGRGSGLTPTGDDLLVGVLHALWVWLPASPWPAQIAEAAAPRTTTLSAAFIRAAAAGEASEAWHWLAAGEPGAVARIVATGHRSGAETWLAFVKAGERVSRESG